MTVRAVLFDAKGADREVDLTDGGSVKVDDHRLLWIDLDSRDPDDLARAGPLAILDLSPAGVEPGARVIRPHP